MLTNDRNRYLLLPVWVVSLVAVVGTLVAWNVATAHADFAPDMVLGGGMVFSALFVWMMWTFLIARQKSVALIATMTLELQKKEVELSDTAHLKEALLEAKKEVQKEIKKNCELAQLATVAKNNFLSAMSHEIRTPMNGIMGMTSLLLDTQLSREQRNYAEIVRSSSDSLMELLNDIIDFAKIEAGKLALVTVDFPPHTLFSETAALMTQRMRYKGLEFICDIASGTPLNLHGDPERLRQILLNLLSNAIKFTHKGKIEARMSLMPNSDSDADAADGSVLRFSVRDTGIGIPADKFSSLFQRFSQVDASITRKYGGTGLGLAICKNLTLMMGGEMGVNSVEGKGSEFWFTVRLAKQTHEVSHAALPVSIQELRVLVVDDDKTLCEILRYQLRALGVLRAEEALDSLSALSVLHKAKSIGNPFHVVITDLLIPDIDGAMLGRILKAEDQLKDIYLVMLTSHIEPGQNARMMELGFNACLTKPYDIADLLACLNTAVSRSIESAYQPSQRETPRSAGKISRWFQRILLVEDLPINQMVATSLLKKLGLTVDVAVNGVEAIKALEKMHYDLVLMDIQMPEMDGIEATRQIRSSNSAVLNHAIPIIALTANAMDGDRELYLSAGMNDYIAKPIGFTVLKQKLGQWLPQEAEAKAQEDGVNVMSKISRRGLGL
jgi:signal transduction histidine kinase/DNA-binding response OmpR family regulator